MGGIFTQSSMHFNAVNLLGAFLSLAILEIIPSLLLANYKRH